MRNQGKESLKNDNFEESESERNELFFENVEITPDKPYEFSLRLEKHPIEVNDGDELGSDAVKVRFEGELASLMEKATELKDLPEKERIAALVDLVRSKLSYPFPEAIEAAKKENPELGEWLEFYFGKNPKQSFGIDAGECISRGYGDCKIMSAVYLAAGKSAGLKGIVAGGHVKNIERPDTNSLIFKSSELQRDQEVGHAWVEIQLSDGTWVPVDVSTNMIAPDPEMLEFFKNANYRTLTGGRMEELPKGLQGTLIDAYFEAGQNEGDFTARIEIMKSFDFTRNAPTPRVPKSALDEFKGNLRMRLESSTDRKRMDLEVLGGKDKEA
jgi:hypothetical protein